jgi:flagellar motor protein MotB
MAAGGGGAWKVAYADFVTAMMAFFLVMWLVTQDKQVKESVARYFTDPSGFYQIGTNKKPTESGAIFEQQNMGKVPGKNYQIAGRGRGSHTDYGQGEAETAAITETIMADPEQAKYWREQTRRQRENAAHSDDVRQKYRTIEDATRMQLALQIEHEMLERIPRDLDPMHRELLMTAMNHVDWTGVADEVLSQGAEQAR